MPLQIAVSRGLFGFPLEYLFEAQVCRVLSLSAMVAAARSPEDCRREGKLFAVSFNLPEKKPRSAARLHRAVEKLRLSCACRQALHHFNHSLRPQNLLRGSEHDDKRWRVYHQGSHSLQPPFQTPLVPQGHSANVDMSTGVCIVAISVDDAVARPSHALVTSMSKRSAVERLDGKFFVGILLLTLGDLFEMGEGLLQLLGCHPDQPCIFVPAAHMSVVAKLAVKSMQQSYNIFERQQGAGGGARGSCCFRVASLAPPRAWSSNWSTLATLMRALRQDFHIPAVLLNAPWD